MCFLRINSSLCKKYFLRKGSCYEKQSIRSMIEMLGVLAIIGVLSVGRCKYNNDILPMSPDLAAKGCSCSGNTCQFSVMFP